MSEGAVTPQGEATPRASIPTSARPRIHLDYLDGIRAIAAVYVTIGHIFQFVYTGVPAQPRVPHWLGLLTSIFKFGDYAVGVFIVLSGYCLMLPVARSVDHCLSGGMRNFIFRRSRRILPPYFACLVLTIGLILGAPNLARRTGTQWDFALPALTTGSVLSHAFMIHNLFSKWHWSIDPPMWTVALEWQIYFVFAIVLLPIWRKFGSRTTIAAAFAIGLIPVAFGLGFINTWFVGLFALGMTAAVVNFSPDSHRSNFTQRVPWLKSSACLFVIVAALSIATGKRLRSELWTIAFEVGIGVVTAMFLTGCTRRLQQEAALPKAVRLLSSRSAVAVGQFSYSLYLIHYPLLALFYLGLLRYGWSIGSNVLVLLFVFLPLVLATSYLFHRCFELPLMRKA